MGTFIVKILLIESPLSYNCLWYLNIYEGFWEQQLNYGSWMYSTVCCDSWASVSCVVVHVIHHNACIHVMTPHVYVCLGDRQKHSLPGWQPERFHDPCLCWQPDPPDGVTWSPLVFIDCWQGLIVGAVRRHGSGGPLSGLESMWGEPLWFGNDFMAR